MTTTNFLSRPLYEDQHVKEVLLLGEDELQRLAQSGRGKGKDNLEIRYRSPDDEVIVEKSFLNSEDESFPLEKALDKRKGMDKDHILTAFKEYVTMTKSGKTYGLKEKSLIPKSLQKVPAKSPLIQELKKRNAKKDKDDDDDDDDGDESYMYWSGQKRSLDELDDYPFPFSKKKWMASFIITEADKEQIPKPTRIRASEVESDEDENDDQPTQSDNDFINENQKKKEKMRKGKRNLKTSASSEEEVVEPEKSATTVTKSPLEYGTQPSDPEEIDRVFLKPKAPTKRLVQTEKQEQHKKKKPHLNNQDNLTLEA
ncbi:ATP-binding cassette sub-family F member 1-like [Montipora foliosa]|uniref:ATP-binding cassette sub-family F member 1-like n=1 Tax=Montipora foliosa TaxID=591990 RepID=UPI0035F1FE6C